MTRYVFDLEADGLLEEATTIWCGVFRNLKTSEVIRIYPDEVVTIPQLLKDCTLLIGHNIVKYDLPLMEKVLGFSFDGGVVDTLLVSQMLEPDKVKREGVKAGPHSLENWGAQLGRQKPEHEDWSQFSEDMMHRCSEDVEINFEVYELLMRMAEGHNWDEAFKIEFKMFNLLAAQEKYGFFFDWKTAVKHIHTLGRYMQAIDDEVSPQLPLRMIISEQKAKGVYKFVNKVFLKKGGVSASVENFLEKSPHIAKEDVVGPFCRLDYIPFDLGSAAQIKVYLLSQGWVPNEWNFSKLTGERTSPKLTEDDDFLGITSNVGKLIAKRVKYRHRKSQLEGFLKRVRSDGRIAAEVSGLAPTARLKHKGVVNIPGGEYDENGVWQGAVFGHEMREVFIAPDGYNIVGCDIASCQLRMLCHYMGDESYTDAVVSGRKELGTDIHTVNMRLAGCKNRADAKTLIYAILFGAGNAKLAAQLGCSQKEAAAMRKRFMDGLPKLKKLLAQLKKVWKARGYLIGLDGRKIFVRSEHMLLVYLLQGAEAVLMKVATLFACKWINVYRLDANMVAHMHDEYQFEVKEEICEEVGELLSKAVVKAGEYLKLTVPMAGEYDIGKNWAETH